MLIEKSEFKIGNVSLNDELSSQEHSGVQNDLEYLDSTVEEGIDHICKQLARGAICVT